MATIYSFIKHTKATQSVSLKVLQKFVLSLNQKELQHVIILYLKSVMKECVNHDVNGLTLKQSVNRFLIDNNPKAHTVSTVNKQILNKMDKKYGIKYNKKIMKQLQQNHAENKHLLSITPNILASSFQFLSFRELCKIQHTCSYFVYLHHNMNGQCNYYINLDRKLLQRAMEYRIPLNTLTKFKHIKIERMYHGRSTRYTWLTRKTKLFDHISKSVIKSSRNSLRTLEIDIYSSHGNGHNVTPRLCLYYIMYQCECNLYPNITKLIWNRESSLVSPLELKMDEIKNNLLHRMPKLNEFVFGFRKWHINHFDSLSAFDCIVHIAKFDKLQLLDLKCDEFNLFQQNNKIINILSKLSKLKKLTINTKIDETNIVSLENGINNTSLQCLTLKLAIKEMAPNIDEIFNALFSSFIGINHFAFESLIFSSRSRLNWQCSRTVLGYEYWDKAFKCLFQHKRLQLINHGELYPLESVVFTVLTDDAVSIVKCLKSCQLETSYNIKHFGFTLMVEYTSNMEHYDEFIEDQLIPFIKLTKTQKELNSADIHFGVVNKRYNWYNYNIFNAAPVHHLDAIIKLLSNLPPVLKELKLTLPYTDSIRYNRKESKLLVKKLTELLSEKNGDSKLETIVLNKIRFCTDFKEYLTFMFGYNNNIHIQPNDKYHFCFKK